MTEKRTVAQLLKDSLSNITAVFGGGNNTQQINQEDKTIYWSADNEDTIIIKKIEFEELKDTIHKQYEEIKKCKYKEDEFKSIIEDYEGTFTSMLKRELGRGSGTKNVEAQVNNMNKYEDEILRLKTNEERLKSHIQALQRDLLMNEEKNEQMETAFENRIETLRTENTDLRKDLVDAKNTKSTLNRKNLELKLELDKKCEDLAKLIEICKFISK
ncbi:hypothetical protein ENBRE01_0171 [Enteropsectra breve]|nr:hypothetical protein ENBRE01_0171 [Enteropsectra breve]